MITLHAGDRAWQVANKGVALPVRRPVRVMAVLAGGKVRCHYENQSVSSWFLAGLADLRLMLPGDEPSTRDMKAKTATRATGKKA